LLGEKDKCIEELLGQLHHLCKILENEGDVRPRADTTIIAQLTQANAARMPELEAPQEPTGAPEASSEREKPPDTTGYSVRTWVEEYRPSRWRMVFGG